MEGGLTAVILQGKGCELDGAKILAHAMESTRAADIIRKILTHAVFKNARRQCVCV